MATFDGSAEPPPAGVERIRPSGWSPGTGTLLGAWLASAAIARLTGAAAVILLLATALVAMVFEIVAGWWSARSIHVRSVVAPTNTNVGERVDLLVGVDAQTSARSIERRRITLTLTDGTVVSLPPDGTGVARRGARGGATDADIAAPKTDAIAARFDTPGVVAALIVRLDVAGPAGLIWWKRTRTIALDPVHVAPVAAGPLVAIESSTSMSDGAVTARRGNHGGEIDGVRPWRQGDATNSVHWVSSLRADELIVHDRLSATDQRWLVDLDAAGPSRLRWTLDEGRRHGHDVAVRTSDSARHAVRSEDDAARWSAIAAQAEVERDAHASGSEPAVRRIGILQRPIRLQRSAVVSVTRVTAPARWAAGAAAFASMAMLVGAIGGSGATLALVFAAVVVGAAVSLWVAGRSGRRPLPLQVAIVGAMLLALAVIAARAVDVDGVLAALRGPLPNVLMLLVVLHGFEVIDHRTLRVHLAITFVLASYAAGLRIDGALGWWLAAWCVPFVVSMLTTLREPGRGVAGRGVRGASRRRAVPRQPSAVGSARTTGRWIVSFVAIGAATLALLSLVPIPDGPARLGLPALTFDAPTVDSPGGLARPDGSTEPPDGEPSPDRAPAGDVVGYPGFTETLDTSVRGELGDQIVMRVRAPEPAFWRGQTFTDFDGRTWTVSPELGQSRTGPMIDVPPTIGDAIGAAVPSRELIQTYFVEQDLPNVVFAAARADQVIFDGSLWTRPDGALRSDVTLTAGSVYTVISQRPQVDANLLRAQGDLGEFFAGFRAIASSGDDVDHFLELPASTTRRTIDLATMLRTPGESTYDTILAYEAWLGANTEYDLDAPVPADGADAVDDFLFESQLGFCEQIASTLTIMLRSQGVPARLATGYIPGERDRVSGVWNVRSSDAHAWVEVWFPQTGWQPFDPTAEVPLAADAGGDTIGTDLIGATVSSIVSYRLTIGVAALAAGGAWVLVRLVALVRYRRRRGRWGLLQDRFTSLVSGSPEEPVVATNAHIASAFADADAAVFARTVGDELDRAGFDPTWVDDDERYEHARSTLATLERSQR